MRWRTHPAPRRTASRAVPLRVRFTTLSALAFLLCRACNVTRAILIARILRSLPPIMRYLSKLTVRHAFLLALALRMQLRGEVPSFTFYILIHIIVYILILTYFF